MKCEFGESNVFFAFESLGIPIIVQQPLYLFRSTPSLPSKLDPKDSSVYTCNIYIGGYGVSAMEKSCRFVSSSHARGGLPLDNMKHCPTTSVFLAFFVGEVSLSPPP